MMNVEIEKSFVKEYIKKNRRDRILYELNNAKKRINAIGRFCHNAADYLIASKIVYKGTSLEHGMELLNVSNSKECYLISFDDDIDGKVFAPMEAMERIESIGMASIAIFTDFCVIKTEQSVGPAEVFFLKASNSAVADVYRTDPHRIHP